MTSALSESNPLPGRYLAALGLIAYSAALLLAGAHPHAGTWGFNLLGYLPSGSRLAVTGLLVGGLAAVLGGAFVPSHGVRVEGARVPAQRTRPWLGLLLVPLATVLWQFRDRSHLLGDGLVWIDNIRAGSHPLYSEPLAATAWYGFAHLASLLGVGLTEASLAWLPILCGLAASLLLYLISSEAFSGTSDRALFTAIFLTLGIVQLYFGYIESYPIVSVAVLIYMYLLIRGIRGRAPLAVVGIALAIAITCHLLALYLFPSFILLLIKRSPGRSRVILLSALPVATALALLLGLGYQFNTILEPLSLISAGAPTPVGALILSPENLSGRLWDLVNLLLLLGAIPIIVAGALRLGSSPRAFPNSQIGGIVAITAAAAGLFAAIGLSLVVSPTQDWDLICIALVPSILLAVMSAVHLLHAARPIVRTGVLMVNAAAGLSFVLVNADARTAVTRYEALLAPDMRLSAHERAYGNERLVKTFSAHGEVDSALVYAKRSLQAEPNNGRYWGNVGSTLFNLGRYADAIPYLEEAERRTPGRAEARYILAQAYMQVGRYRDAVAPLREAIAEDESLPKYHFALGLALVNAGDRAEAKTVWEQTRSRWPDYGRARQAMIYYFGQE